MNEMQNYSFICQTDKFIFLFFIMAVIAMQPRTLRVFIGSFMIT
jgi:hypothetical protein